MTENVSENDETVTCFFSNIDTKRQTIRVINMEIVTWPSLEQDVEIR